MKAYYDIGYSGLQVIQMTPNEAVIEDLYVDPEHRGQGVGKQLMLKACKDADIDNVTLFVKPHPFGSYDIEEEKYYPPGLTYKQLCAFYRSFGFRFQPKPSEVMKRTPK